MTRRALLSLAAVGGVQRVVLSVDHVIHRHAKFRAGSFDHFSSYIWPQAADDLHACGVSLVTERRDGEIRRTPGGQPIFTAVRPGVINMIITDHVPLAWDNGRALAGVAVRYPQYDVCVIALNEAHAHKIPFVAVNTCLHELLHVVLGDTAGVPPEGWRREASEFRTNVLATRLWLFRDGARVRAAAAEYVRSRGLRT